MAAGLNDALEALLYRRTDREAFLAGDVARFGLSPADADALLTIDRVQLVAAAKMAREHVLSRSHRGVGSLVHAFRETIATWDAVRPGRDLDDLASDFVGSRHFDAYRTTSFAGQGICLEESFFRFAEERSIGEPALRLREFVIAILRGLVKTPAPAFALPAIVRRAPEGFFVVDERGPTLFAVLRGNFVEGPITKYLAAVLTSASAPTSVPPMTDIEQAAVRVELGRLGLLAP